MIGAAVPNFSVPPPGMVVPTGVPPPHIGAGPPPGMYCWCYYLLLKKQQHGISFSFGDQERILFLLNQSLSISP